VAAHIESIAPESHVTSVERKDLAGKHECQPRASPATHPELEILLRSFPRMRAAAILGLGCSPRHLKPFQTGQNVEWGIGLPGPREAADVILVLGGDGTVHRHLAQLVRLGLPVLVVPAGSGNDFARALGFRHARDSVASWEKFCVGAGNTRSIDLGVITPLENTGGTPAPRYFGCVASVGLDAEVARRANRIPRWLRGNGGYVLALVPTIFRFAPCRMKILISVNPQSISACAAEACSLASDGGPDNAWIVQSDLPTLLAALANAPLYGGGMKIAPRANMEDGLLDVCVVSAVDPFKLFCMFPTVYGGRHLKIREVKYSQTARVRIETERPLDIYADGELVCKTPAEIGVQRGALTILSP
jgi:diacylglycerol kinase (ATP)